MKKKAIVAVVALVLVLCCAMGGTLAWLVDSTTEVKNTFTYGDINISLWEHKLNEDGLTLSDDVFTGAKQTGFKMIPGNKIEKDPTVTVEADSEACWLFVKVEKSSNFDNFMTYDIDTKWTELDAVNHPGVYYYNEDELDSLLTKDKEYYDESVETAYEEYAKTAPAKVRSDFERELEYDNWRLESEASLPHGVNMASAEENYNDNANDVRGQDVKAAGTAQSEQPVSTNAFLEGNNYHKPDYSMKSGLDVIDFTMHWNFSTAQKAFDGAVANYDYKTGKVGGNVSAGGDYTYNDSTWNVTYVDSHDYSPDGNFEYRYDGGTEAWAENLCLLFTFRGIPCIYYGSEIEFQAGKKIDVAQNDLISNSGSQ